MITEDYVSFEVAKLLKDKGFDEPCNSFYEYKKKLYIHDMDTYFPNGMKNSDHDKENNKGISAPTLQMVCKWLREVHNLHVDIGYDDLDWFWNIISISEDVPIADRPKFIVTGTACHRTYEEAVEAAIKYCIENLI